MKKNHFFANANIWLVCTSLLLSSCEKAPEMNITTEEIIIEATQTDAVTFGISSNVTWMIKTIQDDVWLTVHPTEGKGNATITVKASENIEFTERMAFIVISGEGVITDTVKIIQTPSLDIAEKIEDEVFKEYCLKEFDRSPEDGRISTKEALTVIEINVKGKKINSLAGIEYFTRLRNLYCSFNNIEEIDVSKNKDIRILDCSSNPISKIDVSELSRLKDLFLHNTEIQSINVSKNAELYQLTTSNSPISSIDVTKNKDLAILLCNDNQLKKLDVTQNTKLLMLFCGNNMLTELDLSMNTKLVNLWCNNQTDGNNQKVLKHIDISKNKDLQSFSCGQNNISYLDLTNNPELTQLRCEENQLTELDIRQNEKIGDLKCNNNKLKDAIDISNNKLLRYLDLRKNPSLTTIHVWRGFKDSNYFEKDSSARYVEKE